MTPGARREAIVPGSLWRHYKGTLYIVDAWARLEATKAPVVVYRRVGGSWNETWVRPVDDFLAVLPGGMERFAYEPRATEPKLAPVGDRAFPANFDVNALQLPVAITAGFERWLFVDVLARCEVEGCLRRGYGVSNRCTQHR